MNLLIRLISLTAKESLLILTERANFDGKKVLAFTL